MRQKQILLALPCAIALLAMANVFCGSVSIPASEVWHILCGRQDPGNTAWYMIVHESRIPQAVTAMFCGASLGTCGLLLQTAFRNPLAGPSILGIDAGASLGVALVLLGFGSTWGNLGTGTHALAITAAMGGAIATMLLLLALARTLHDKVMLLVSGVVIANVTGSMIQLLNYGATEQGIRSFVVWGMGDFSGVANESLPTFIALTSAGLLLAALLVKPLDALLLGDRYAQELGIGIRRTRQWLLLTTGLLTAVTTAYCGPIAFIGLAVPHMARMTLASSSHRTLLPGTMMTGACLALTCNLLSTTLPSNGGIIPINVITPLMGAPVILYIILKNKS